MPISGLTYNFLDLVVKLPNATQYHLIGHIWTCPTSGSPGNDSATPCKPLYIGMFAIAAKRTFAKNTWFGIKLLTETAPSLTIAMSAGNLSGAVTFFGDMQQLMLGPLPSHAPATLVTPTKPTCTYSPVRSRKQVVISKNQKPSQVYHRHPPTHSANQIFSQTARVAENARSTCNSPRGNNNDENYFSVTTPLVGPQFSFGPAYTNMILEQASASPLRSAPLQDQNSPDTFTQWLQVCLESYVAHFHHRWHIITATTYEFIQKSFDNAATVIMVGLYFLNQKDNGIIELHHCLVDHYLDLLAVAAEQGKPPPTAKRLETYQAIVLHIIFGLYLGVRVERSSLTVITADAMKQEKTVARANILCCQLIRVLRSTGFFHQSSAQQTQQEDYPGSYGPWVEMVVDEWTRLVAVLFRVETLISIICLQRPRILDDELDAHLPSSFALRNCYGMHVFLHRQQVEDPSRSKVQMLWMIRQPETFYPNKVLVEDIQLGLCGLHFDILRIAQLHTSLSTCHDPTLRSMRDDIGKQLVFWAGHLEAVAKTLSSHNPYSTDKALGSAYLGQEESSDPGGQRQVIARIMSIFHETTLLYHLLRLLLSTSLRNLRYLQNLNNPASNVTQRLLSNMVSILITGSADGFGLEAARQLVQRGHAVYLHARSQERAADAKAACAGAAGVFVADLSLVSEMRSLAEQVQSVGQLDVIIHNAGMLDGPFRKTADTEIPAMVAVNVLAPYILSCLLPIPKRLIFISSQLHRQADTSADDIFWRRRGEAQFQDFQAYCDSKLHVILLTNALAKRLPGVSVLSVHPGWVATKLGGSGATDKLEDGVETYVGLAEGNYDQSLTGVYFEPKMRLGKPFAVTGDINLQENVVEACAAISGLELPQLR
ncbi:Short-chain dehydrogenase chyC [Paramyrothecium foliicola]|nr:Short-chain dehydrogenase chyC [Paramyrothecium foliicola]